jgi:DNA-binding HxlR family transcriptional regulator/putative sterol carrier protein
VPTARRYDDPCGIARALDVIGDRWALLVIRELIFGPRRFVQLRGGLRGVSPNVLAQRLRDLQEAGVVRRDVLDPPASVAIYELTARGRALEPVMHELGRWGSREPVATDAELSVSALLFALKTVFDPAAAADAMFALRVDGDWYRLTVAGGSIDVSRTRTERPDVAFEADAATLRSVAFGREPVAQAERDGRLTVSGDRLAADRFALMFVNVAGRASACDPAAVSAGTKE